MSEIAQAYTKKTAEQDRILRLCLWVKLIYSASYFYFNFIDL